MIIEPQDFNQHSAYELLEAASQGMLGIDQRWLHALVDDPAKTLPDIVRFASEDRSEDRVVLDQDLISIFHYLKAPEGIPFLIADIRRDPKEISDEVVEALVQIGEPAVEPLLELYAELPEEHRGEIAFLLAGMGVRDARVLDLLLSRLDVDFGDALFHLEVYHDPSAIPTLEKRLETAAEEQLPDLRDTVKDLAEPRPETHIVPFDIWELYAEEAGPDFAALDPEERLQFLDSVSPFLRAEAALDFFGEELTVETRAKLIEKGRTDPDEEVRASCWTSFFQSTEDPQLRDVMMERLADPAIPRIERSGLALGLADHADQAVVRDAILELVEYPETRARSIEAMWRSNNTDFGPIAAQYLDDPDMEVRRSCIWAIGYLQVKDHAPLLRKFFDSEDLRIDALHNFAIVVPGQTTKAKIPVLYKKIEELAKGFADSDEEAVKSGLDIRLMMAGLDPIYHAGGEEAQDAPPEPVVAAPKVGRNDPCPCGSGKKYKKCCGQ